MSSCPFTYYDKKCLIGGCVCNTRCPWSDDGYCSVIVEVVLVILDDARHHHIKSSINPKIWGWPGLRQLCGSLMTLMKLTCHKKEDFC